MEEKRQSTKKKKTKFWVYLYYKINHYLLYLAPALSVAILIQYLYFTDRTTLRDEKEIILWYGVSLFLVIGAYLQNLFFKKEAENVFDRIVKKVDSGGKNIEDLVKEHLTPSIFSYEDTDSVKRVAANILSQAGAEKDEERKYVVYFGGPSLATSKGREQEFEEDEELMESGKPVSATLLYTSALGLLIDKEVSIRRYINLPDKEQIGGRNKELQDKYRNWIKQQLERIRSNRFYSVVDAIRAPRYGSSQSIIFTSKSILFVMGDGESAILINGEEISRKTLKKMETHVAGSDKKLVRYSKDGCADLKTFCDTL